MYGSYRWMPSTGNSCRLDERRGNFSSERNEHRTRFTYIMRYGLLPQEQPKGKKMGNQNNVNDSANDTQNPGFRVVLDSLLAACEPILSEDLALAKSPDKIQDPGDGPNCDAEIELATRIFGKFWNEKVAVSLLPAEALQQFGAVDKWTWCYRHIECCTIFGWLLCRGPRGIRGYSYYLHEYWLCVRQAIGKPVSNPPTPAETKDYQTLVTALAGAYQPYLREQAAAADQPVELSSEVISGKIDCAADTDDA